MMMLSVVVTKYTKRKKVDITHRISEHSGPILIESQMKVVYAYQKMKSVMSIGLEKYEYEYEKAARASVLPSFSC